ncbi:hypothetical protein HMPREF9108_00161 [Leptotrichia sp. oral taxon 225 str. F0581]|nr:hypothetical protein HMPREF9108_00161 [Leptotrichia sp. oral taxon 225 str. F0581]
MGIKFNLGTNGGPTSKSKKMKSLFMGVCEYQKNTTTFAILKLKI